MTENKGCVYFFRHIGLSPIKIGYSTHESPLDRFNQFKTYAPFGSEIIGFIQTNESKEIESFLHKKYINKRINGEWFEITVDEVQKEIDFYSNIEDIKDRNEFQIAWAEELYKRKNTPIDLNKMLKIPVKDQFIKMYSANNNINKVDAANILKVSRRSIYNWINEYENSIPKTAMIANKSLSARDKFKELYTINPDLNRSEVAELLNVSRKQIQRYIAELSK
jgi:transposase